MISPEMRGHAINAISNLRTDSPILAALDRIPIEPGVRYHSIIPLIGGTADTDGVVEYRSSHLEGAASELIFAGTHISQQDPAVIRELDRILREHLAAVSSPISLGRDEVRPDCDRTTIGSLTQSARSRRARRSTRRRSAIEPTGDGPGDEPGRGIRSGAVCSPRRIGAAASRLVP